MSAFTLLLANWFVCCHDSEARLAAPGSRVPPLSAAHFPQWMLSGWYFGGKCAADAHFPPWSSFAARPGSIPLVFSPLSDLYAINAITSGGGSVVGALQRMRGNVACCCCSAQLITVDTNSTTGAVRYHPRLPGREQQQFLLISRFCKHQHFRLLFVYWAAAHYLSLCGQALYQKIWGTFLTLGAGALLCDEWIDCQFIAVWPHASLVHRTLDLCKVSGTIPQSVSNMTKIKSLALMANPLSGTMSELFLKRATDLVFLILGLSDKLSGTMGFIESSHLKCL